MMRIDVARGIGGRTDDDDADDDAVGPELEAAGGGWESILWAWLMPHLLQRLAIRC